MAYARMRGGFAMLSVVAMLAGPAVGPAVGQPAIPPTSTPFSTPDTDNCPDRYTPAPPIDASESPEPGQAAPPPLPLPATPAGGPNMSRCGVTAPEGAPPVPADLSAGAWVLADLDTGKVLAAKDPHGRYRPASTIKVLLSLVALRNLNLDTVVAGTAGDMAADGTRVGIGPGGRYSNLQLMQALLMCSGNDAAHAIAMQLGGMDATVAKMNTAAAALGAQDTRAATPSGLDGPGMSTSAYDMALFFRAATAIPQFVSIIHTEQAPFPGYPANPNQPGDTPHPGFSIGNDNTLLYNYDGAIGFKNGYTDDARQTLVGAAQRGGHRIEVVLLHADVLPARPPVQAARLLDYGFALENASLPPVGDLVAPGSDSTPRSAPQALPLASPPTVDPVAGGRPRGTWARTTGILGGTVLVFVLLWAALRRKRRY
jgi:D-alanyl-D-alanine carboxypeptidase (penicillin-binding protein 5/6)